MKIKKINPLGAEISNIDLKENLSTESYKLIKQAFLENLVLIFKDQNLSPNDLLSVTKIWGQPQIHPVFKGLDEYPEIIKIENHGQEFHANAHWHSDVTFEEEPPDATILYAIEMPDKGGNTLFASQYLAYESLEQSLKEKFSSSVAINSNKSVILLAGADLSLVKSVKHPIFRTHPETDKKALYVTQAFVEKIEGLSNKESEDLLSLLYEHCSKKEFIYEHKWHKGDLVIWDNRCVQHFAVHDHGNQTRTLHRITVNGSKPY